ncbi:MAG: primosomal protein N', partial [Methanomicrobia archaeon]|nr:primosomal protein N' [Methanomicrobia archaeon]
MLDKAKEVLASGKSVIILMPSLEAIGSVKDRVKETLNVPVFLLDKKLTPKKELEIWFEIQQGIPCVALGTLSAVFAPMPQLGSIVICEEENTVYKQEQSPFFRVHHIAQCRCEIENAMLVLTSAAPSVETYKQAQDKQWEIVSFFPKEYSGFQLIDMSNYKSQRATFLSFPLQNMIYRSLEENKKIVLVMNRKGFTTTTRCSCGHTMRCQRCDVNMIYMYAKQKLVCRHCGKEEELPKMCAACKTSYLHSSGGGIEKLESEVARFYPQARVARYDRDTPRFPKDAQIIISTQAITKMQDQMIFDIVALLDFDAQLNRFDFRCANKVFSLLVVLRQMAKEKLLVQTSMRDSYLLKYLDAMDFKGFYKKELSLRKELGFPPSQHLLSIVVRGEKEEIAFQQVKELCDILQAQDIKKVEISDPHPDIVPKLRDKYRFTIVLKSRSAKENLTLARKALSDFKKRKG